MDDIDNNNLRVVTVHKSTWLTLKITAFKFHMQHCKNRHVLATFNKRMFFKSITRVFLCVRNKNSLDELDLYPLG